jgi:hypothetical protein
MTNSEHRQLAWQIIRSALQAVDPAQAVKDYFNCNPDLVAQIQATPGRVS